MGEWAKFRKFPEKAPPGSSYSNWIPNDNEKDREEKSSGGNACRAGMNSARFFYSICPKESAETFVCSGVLSLSVIPAETGTHSYPVTTETALFNREMREKHENFGISRISRLSRFIFWVAISLRQEVFIHFRVGTLLFPFDRAICPLSFFSALFGFLFDETNRRSG